MLEMGVGSLQYDCILGMGMNWQEIGVGSLQYDCFLGMGMNW